MASELRLQNLRRPLSSAMALDVGETKQLEKVLRAEDVASIDAARASKEGWPSLELMDVVRDGALVYRLVLYPFGNGVMFDGDTPKVLVDIAQHGAEARPGQAAALDALKLAFARDAAGLGVKETIDFPAAAVSRANVAQEDRLAQIEAAIARGEPTSEDDGDHLLSELSKIWPKREKLPMARRSEVDPSARRILRALLAGKPYFHNKLRDFGLPSAAASLSAFLDVTAAEGLDREIVAEGYGAASIIALAREAVAGLVKTDAVLDGIDAIDAAAASLAQLITSSDYRLTFFGQKDDPLPFLVALARRVPGGDQQLIDAMNDDGAKAKRALEVWIAMGQSTVPADVASALRGFVAGSSPQTLLEFAPSFDHLLRGIPQAERLALTEGMKVFARSPAGGSVAPHIKVDPLGLVAARTVRSSELLESVAEAIVAHEQIQAAREAQKKKRGAVDPALVETLVEAGDAGRDAVASVMERTGGAELEAIAKQLGVAMARGGKQGTD